jgi:hypothetical protein
MSYRKTKLIQERNILLERKHILEQAPPPAPSSGATGTTTPPPTSSSTPSPEKISKDTIKTLPSCVDVKNAPKENEREKIEQDGITMYKKTGSKTPYCKDEKK